MTNVKGTILLVNMVYAIDIVCSFTVIVFVSAGIALYKEESCIMEASIMVAEKPMHNVKVTSHDVSFLYMLHGILKLLVVLRILDRL